MAATNYTPIQLYRTTTAAATPSAGNLAAGELAINLTDEKLYFKNAAGVVKLLASSGGAVGTVSSVDVSGGTTGLTTSGGPITTSGTITLAGTLGVANGGTGATSLTSGYLVKGNGTSAASASVVYDDGTNVGIGTSSPSGTLHVVRSAADSVVNITSGSNTLQLFENTSGDASLINYASGKSITVSQAGAGFINFGVNGSERMRVTAAGDVGIGTSSPGAKLAVSGTVNFTGALTSGDLADAVGYKGIPQNAQTASYTLALSDIGKHISITTGGVVIPANGSVAFPVGSAVVIYNDSASSQTISITTDTLRQAGTANAGSRTLAQYGLCTVTKVASTTWVISGAGVS